MAESHERELAAKRLLKDAAAAAFVGTCLETDFREAIAAAKQAGKPMLTEKGINDFIASKSKEQLRPLMEEAATICVPSFASTSTWPRNKRTDRPGRGRHPQTQRCPGNGAEAEFETTGQIRTAKAPPPASAKTEAHPKAAPGGGGGTHITVSILGHEVLNITVERSSKT